MKKILIPLIIGLFFLINTSNASANIGAGAPCSTDPGREACIDGYSCQPTNSPNPASTCQRDFFGPIKPPDVLKGDPTGAGRISEFLSNGITLIYSIAGLVLIFMLLWGAFEWLTSGGDKEKLSSAQKRIINAIIGIILFAVAFAVIQVLGTFTGFRFFNGQNGYSVTKRPDGSYFIQCPSGRNAVFSTLPADPFTAVCKN